MIGNKSLIKKVILIIVVAVLAFLPYFRNLVYAENNAPTKIINVVYDDSGSMIYDFSNNQKVDTWCQAKYSMEVFAAMLGQKDIMNIYVMSDYYKKTTGSPRLSLRGEDGAKVNVEKVHNLITAASETPFDAVRKAYEDLQFTDADEKWLVILTDGAFGDLSNEGVDEYFDSKSADVKVMFLGIGASAAAITEKSYKDIYFEKAETSDQILNEITDICTRIFNSDKLQDIREKQITFDIPMSELTVFAQGASVQIKGLVGPDGKSINSDVPVEVKYSEVATSRKLDKYANPKIDTELAGSIVTFHGDFNPGTYSLNVSGAETLEVYYKPNVELMAYLIDERGREVAYAEGVREGEYELRFGFVKAGTTEKISESPLLGNVNYQAEMSYNGEEQVSDYSYGEKLNVQEGKYDINVIADYLKYNTVSTQLKFEVFRDKNLNLRMDNLTQYNIHNEGIFDFSTYVDPLTPIRVQVLLEDIPFTREQWENIGTIGITMKRERDQKKSWDDINFRIEKTDEIGVYNVYLELPPKLKGRNYSETIGLELELQHRNGNELWYGETTGEVQLCDNRDLYIKEWEKIKVIIAIAAIVVLVLGYVPGIKKYLPKKLKSKPQIFGRPKSRGVKPAEGWGKLKKNRLTIFLPYVREKGSIRCLPKGKSGVTLKVRAAGDGKMDLLNVKEFAGKEKILFNGISIPKDARKKQITAGTEVKTIFTEMTYTCVLNK